MKTTIFGIILFIYSSNASDPDNAELAFLLGIVFCCIGGLIIFTKIATHDYKGGSFGSNIGEIFAELAVDSIDFGSGDGGGGYGDGGGGGGDGGG